jgi:hypothetical protein
LLYHWEGPNKSTIILEPPLVECRACTADIEDERLDR